MTKVWNLQWDLHTEGRSWFKINNLALALGMALKFYSSVAKGLKIKVRKSFGLILMTVEVTRGKLEGAFLPPPPPPTHTPHLE